MVQEQRHSLDALNARFETQQQELITYKSRIAHLEKLLAEQQTELDHARRDIGDTQKKNSELSQNIAAKDQVIQDIITSKDAQPTNLEKRIMNELEETKRQMMKYEQQIGDLNPSNVVADPEEDPRVLEAVARFNNP